jgi:capsular polysaccharide biosynthesis protein
MGFEIIDPAALSVDEQIRLFHESAVVVGFTGAAFANCAYCQPDTKVVEIQPKFADAYWVGNLVRQMEGLWFPYFCESRQLFVSTFGGIGMEPVLSIESFLHFLKEVVLQKIT